MTPERYKKITDVLTKRQPDLTVITDEVHKPRNLSAIIRTCDAVGIDQIHSVVPRRGYQTYSGTSASAEKWVDVVYHSTIGEPAQGFKDQGYQLISADLSPDAVDFRAVDYTKPTVLVLGAEVDGISERASALVDQAVIVPMVGMVESFNVSVACAVILMEAQRQRQLAGMYDKARLPGPLYEKRYMQWAHPTIASYCDEHQLDYPPIREDGEVRDLSAWYKHTQKTLTK